MGERECEVARRNAVWIAEQLAAVALRDEEWDPDDPAELAGGGGAEILLRIGSLLLDSWSTDAEIRETLRPLFVTAIPAQRALLALGDIDTWSTGGHDAREWWGMAAQGADRELAALAAWRAARADLRGRRGADTRLLLHQAAEGGFVEAQDALDRLRGCPDDAAARELRAIGAALDRAEDRLREHDLLGAQHVVDRLDPWPGSDELRARSNGIRGEIAFRRGVLASATVWFDRVPSDDPERGGHARLRLAQIALADGDLVRARRRLTALAADAGPDGDQARLLLELHGDLVEEDVEEDDAGDG